MERHNFKNNKNAIPQYIMIRSSLLAFILVMMNVAVCRAQTTGVAAEFPYPTVPDTMKTVEQRAAFVMQHYWDNFNFNDTTLIHKPDITEQGFANFLDLLPRIDTTLAANGIKAFLQKAFNEDTKANVREYFVKQISHYLYDPESPMRNDYIYIMFARRMKDIPTIGIAERERLAFRLKNVAKNMPDTYAADFIYTDRQGNNSSLYATEARFTVLYFNDPDCDNCHRITNILTADRLLDDSSNGVKVLAIYPDADTDEWKRNPQPFPKSWIDAYSPDGEITAKNIYFIRATPTIFLLDSQKRVILKDPSPELLLHVLGEITRHKQ